MILRIRNWKEIFENSSSRKLKSLEWVPVPNTMDTDGYTALLDHPNGAAHYGAWSALLLIASRCKERGTLVTAEGRPHTPKSLARISRIPEKIFEELIARLLSEEIQWLEDISRNLPTHREILPKSANASGESGISSLPFHSLPFGSVPGGSAEGGAPEDPPESVAEPPPPPLPFPQREPPGYALDELYAEFREACAWLGWIDADFREGWDAWRVLDFEQKRAAIAAIRKLEASGQDPGFVPRPKRFFSRAEWKRPLRAPPPPRKSHVEQLLDSLR